MSDLVVVMRSGKEFHFSCENYEIEFSKIDSSLLRFSYEGGIGECPVYIPVNDIEAIAVRGERGKKNDIVVTEKQDCKGRRMLERSL